MASSRLISGMVTKPLPRIRQHVRPRLFLKEHREAKQLSAEQMAGRLVITRESLYRQERETWRVNPPMQQAWADALGIEPRDLWTLPRPPDARPSLDELVKDQPDEVKDMAADIILRLLKRN
jgi:transcriptional regulator with XRE-family HTH domain